MKRMLTLIAALLVFLGIAATQPQKVKTAKVPLVGILQPVAHPALDAIRKGVVKGLADEGYVVGKNVRVDFKNAQGDQSNLKTMATGLVDAPASVLVGIATPAAQSFANATTKTPIVLGAVTDPKGANLVKDNAHPGGNITGVSDQAPIKAQLALIKTIQPTAKVLGVVATSSDDSAQAQVKQLLPLAKAQGFTVKRYAISNTNDLSQIASQMAQSVDAIFVPTDNTIASAMQTLVAAADAKKVPIYPTVDTMVQQGGLATRGLDQTQLGVATGKMVAQILKGKKPATMPIHFETSGKLIVNLKQAEALGIQIPSELLKEAQTKGQVIK